MRISAGISYKPEDRDTGTRGRGECTAFCLFSSPSLRLSVSSLLLALTLASCSSVRHVAPPESATFTPVEQAESQERPSGFQELKGTRRECVASWYGPEFHGRPTSSGERFNMHALTCAHKEFPFGTKLKVINTKNKKEVECVVNDRGPFIAGRELDLSYAAAKKIDLIGAGIQTVIIEPLGRDLRYAKYIRYGVMDTTLTLQVGSFKEAVNAKRLKMALDMKHKSVYIMEADIGGTKYFRVRIGKFTSRDDAVALGKSLADEGYTILVTKFEQQL